MPVSDGGTSAGTPVSDHASPHASVGAGGSARSVAADSTRTPKSVDSFASDDFDGLLDFSSDDDDANTEALRAERFARGAKAAREAAYAGLVAANPPSTTGDGDSVDGGGSVTDGGHNADGGATHQDGHDSDTDSSSSPPPAPRVFAAPAGDCDGGSTSPGGAPGSPASSGEVGALETLDTDSVEDEVAARAPQDVAGNAAAVGGGGGGGGPSAGLDPADGEAGDSDSAYEGGSTMTHTYDSQEMYGTGLTMTNTFNSDAVDTWATDGTAGEVPQAARDAALAMLMAQYGGGAVNPAAVAVARVDVGVDPMSEAGDGASEDSDDSADSDGSEDSDGSADGRGTDTANSDGDPRAGGSDISTSHAVAAAHGAARTRDSVDSVLLPDDGTLTGSQATGGAVLASTTGTVYDPVGAAALAFITPPDSVETGASARSHAGVRVPQGRLTGSFFPATQGSSDASTATSGGSGMASTGRASGSQAPAPASLVVGHGQQEAVMDEATASLLRAQVLAKDDEIAELRRQLQVRACGRACVCACMYVCVWLCVRLCGCVAVWLCWPLLVTHLTQPHRVAGGNGTPTSRQQAAVR